VGTIGWRTIGSIDFSQLGFPSAIAFDVVIPTRPIRDSNSSRAFLIAEAAEYQLVSAINRRQRSPFQKGMIELDVRIARRPHGGIAPRSRSGQFNPNHRQGPSRFVIDTEPLPCANRCSREHAVRAGEISIAPFEPRRRYTR